VLRTLETILAWYRRLIARKFDGSKHRSYRDGPALHPMWRLSSSAWPRRTGAAVLIGVAHIPDPVGELVALELSEPLEDRLAGIRLFPGVVLNAGVLNIFHPRPQVLQRLPPLTRAFGFTTGSAPPRKKCTGTLSAFGARSTVPNGGAGQTGAMASQKSGRVSPIQSVPPPPIESPVK
jgi:hypothetical protein